MKLLRHLHNLPADYQGCVATIGNFDGLHLGHQAVIQQVGAKAQELGLPSTVITFEPLPIEFFRQPPPPRIYALRDKLRLLKSLPIDYCLCMRFDQALATMPAQAFVETILLKQLKVRYLVVGDDFRFGKDRQGDYQLLQTLGTQAGMQVVDTPTLLQGIERISSTRIRLALNQGDLMTAQQLLGQTYKICGRIRHGDKRGRTIGFPTLNLHIPQYIALRKGVYAVRLSGLGNQSLLGVANVGSRPTVHGIENRLEAHVFDFNEQIYGKHICVEPVKFLRDEMKFASLDHLKSQILLDAEQAKACLQEQN